MYLRLYRVKDWLHFLVLPLAGWSNHSRVTLAGGILGWAFALAFVSAINQAFDDRLDRSGKNPAAQLGRRRALWLSLPPLALSLLSLALFAPIGLFAAAAMMLAAIIYSAPPRLKRIPIVGTLWNVVLGIAGFFFAGVIPLAPLVGAFALLLLASQLIHEAQDRDDDAGGEVHTIATVAGRPVALELAMVVVIVLPLAMWWLARRLDVTLACALFALVWMPLLFAHRRAAELAVLQQLRMRYRYSAIALGAVLFALLFS